MRVWACHSQSCRESGAQSTDWLLAGPRLGRLDAALPPKLVPSCRRLMWRITAVALKACCEDRTRVRTSRISVWSRKRKIPPHFEDLYLF